MNRNQRRGRGARRNEITNRVSGSKNKVSNENDEGNYPLKHGRREEKFLSSTPNRYNVLKSKTTCEIEDEYVRVKPRREERNVANRCCYVTPDQRDFGQTYWTGMDSPEVEPVDKTCNTQSPDRYETILTERFGYGPIVPDTISQLKELKKVLCGNTSKAENASQYSRQKGDTSPFYIQTTDGTQWQDVDNIDDIENLIDDDSPIIYEHLPRHAFISEMPRVKIIAEKFFKYKRNNLELRRLDEKVVCVEYDVFDQPSGRDVPQPVQRMRAFFSIKPNFDDSDNKEDGALSNLPSSIKLKFDIKDEDLKRLTEKEIEIIDGTIEANKSYLEDLRRILKRKKVIHAKKNRTSLDLQSLYEMAKKDRLPFDCDLSEANMLSKAELQEVKDLILQRCASSVHGIRRKRVKRKDRDSAVDVSLISDSIVAELLREDMKLTV